MDIKFYDMHLSAIENSAKRSRAVTIVGIVASILMIVTVYNFAWGAMRKAVTELVELAPKKSPSNQYVIEIYKDIIKNWVDSYFTTPSLFSVKLSANDAPEIGSIAFIVIAIWLVYCQRRENHLIGNAVRCADQECQQIKSYVFHGICSRQVFATVSDNNHPVKSLKSDDGDVNRKSILVLRPILFFSFSFP